MRATHGAIPHIPEELQGLIGELRQIVDRHPDDLVRQKSLDLVPGRSVKEIREALPRRRGR